MRALVLGATGFGGFALTRYLVEQTDWNIVATKRWGKSTEVFSQLRTKIEILDCDVQSLSNVLQVMAEASPELVFFSAADISIRSSTVAPDRTLYNNIFGLLNVLEAAKKLRPQPRVIAIGSCEVYGQVYENEVPVTEEQPFRPQNTYAVSKAAQDLLAYQYFQSYGMEIVRTRTFNYTGVGQSDLYVCSSFARQLAEIEAGLRPPRILVGNLKVRRDFLDVEDLGSAYHALALRGHPGESYNVCSGRTISIGEILDMLVAISGLRIEIVVDPEKLRPVDNMLLCGDNTKIWEHTGWKPSIGLQQTLKKLLEWWRSSPRRVPKPPIQTSTVGSDTT